VLLGEREGRVWFALVVDSPYAEGEGWVGIRELLPHLAADGVEQAPLVFHAIGLAEWLLVMRFCPRCRGRPRPPLAGRGRRRRGGGAPAPPGGRAGSWGGSGPPAGSPPAPPPP